MITLIAVASTIVMMVSLFNANLSLAFIAALVLFWACLADAPKSWWDNEKSTSAGDTDAK